MLHAYMVNFFLSIHFVKGMAVLQESWQILCAENKGMMH